MTEKRFKQVVDGVKDTRTGRTLTHPLEFTLKLNEINELYDCVFDRNEELEKENEQLKQFKEKVFVLLDEKIKHYEHKPVSAPVGQSMSVNFDADMDRLARLSELQQLKKELKE